MGTSFQSLGDYAFHPSSMAKTKEDPVTVAHRKRMLAVFLNRLIRHPVLGRERVLWQFLAQDVSWSEVLQQPPLTNLPKNPMKAPAHNPSDPDLQVLFSHLPVPSSSSVRLQDPGQLFLFPRSLLKSSPPILPTVLKRSTAA
jgi:sorting nexin-4